MDRRRFSAITLLKLMMLASLAVPLALFGYASWSEYRTTFAVADERIQRSLDVLAEQTLKVFQSIELAISNVDEVLRDLKDEDIRAAEERFHQRTKEIVARLSQVQSIWVFDAEGRPLVSSTHYPAPPTINNSERDYFRVQVPNDAGTYIGEVVIPRVGRDTIFTVSRRRPAAGQT